ncbi:MAG: hypothetical protein WDO24_06895 [Pseudomonadota bacterium]
MKFRRLLKQLTTPIVVIVGVLYFLIDAVFLLSVLPLTAWLAGLPIFARLGAWIRRLGPYPTLALFIVPVLILEPAKPIGFYLIAEGRPHRGVLIIAVAEILKLMIVERLFNVSRPKLMSIAAFAWTYNRITGWLAWLHALPGWQWVVTNTARIKAALRRLLSDPSAP